MSEAVSSNDLRRLEDYILLASQGGEVRAQVELRRQPIKQKVHPEETPDMSDEIAMYLLMADYTLTADGRTSKVSKVYMLGSEEESLDSARINRNIATERLKMDYRRLEEGNVKLLEEKFF